MYWLGEETVVLVVVGLEVGDYWGGLLLTVE